MGPFSPLVDGMLLRSGQSEGSQSEDDVMKDCKESSVSLAIKRMNGLKSPSLAKSSRIYITLSRF